MRPRANRPSRSGRRTLSLAYVIVLFVTTYAPDRRFLQGSDGPESLAILKQEAGVRLEADIRLAKALLDLERRRTAVVYGCGSVAQLARRHRLAERDARRLLEFGRAMELEPSIEERVRKGAMSVDAAAEIAAVLPHDPAETAEQLEDDRMERALEAALHGEDADVDPPAASAQGADGPPPLDHSFWIAQAERKTPTPLRKAVRKRLAEVRCGEAVVEIDVHVPESVREGFEVAREIASRKAGRALDDSGTFEAVVDHYLDTFDEMRRQDGKRRVGPTAERPGDRYIPISVRRAVRRRAGDRCEFPGCPNRLFLEFAHWDPHASGSGREAGDLILLCGWHHTMMDAGAYKRLGTASDPVFVMEGVGSFGNVVVTRDAPGGRPPTSEAERGAWDDVEERKEVKERNAVKEDEEVPAQVKATPRVREGPAVDST